MSIQLDLTLALQPTVDGGVDPDALRATPASVVEAVRARVDSGELGFWRLPDDEALAARASELAEALRRKFDQLVVLGIGGSSLGGRAVIEALAPGAPVRFVDNVDPRTVSRLLDEVDLERTCFNVISKSGGTVETAAQLALVRDRLDAQGEGFLAPRVIATTDPKGGLLRGWADEVGLKTLPIPGNVGGRFSVLTAVGLLPAAFAGVDVAALLKGAAEMRARCEGTDPTKNPALALAAVHHQANEAGRPIHVMMPYCDRLKPFAEWFCQLWGESLGKRLSSSGEVIHTGPTPVVALGTTDQHSQVQLYVEGPHDKLVTFLAADPEVDLPFPHAPQPGAEYLAGHTLGELFDAERRGTELALARAGRPSARVDVGAVSARSLGELFFLYEAATAFAGELYGVNAFDQPGVEDGKRIAFALMGREGFAEALEGTEKLLGAEPFVL